MKRLVAVILILVSSASLASAPFTFQGAIDTGGAPLDGSADLTFTVHGQAAGGGSLAGPLSFPNHPVEGGLFSVTLDFPGLVFDGQARFIEVSVNGQVMQPRIQIQAAPLAASALTLRGRAVASAAPQPGDALVWDGSAWAPEAVGGAFSAGIGLNLAGSTFSIAPNYRLPQGCAGDEVVRWSGTQWQCSADQDADTQYGAGTGLTLNGETFRVAPTYRLPQGCSGDQIARWNGSQWSCGNDQDQDTQYTAGSGLSLAGQAFEVDFAGSGTDDAAARSDHDHYGDWFEGNDSTSGLVIFNRSAELSSNALFANSTQAERGVGVYGQALGEDGRGVYGTGETGVSGFSDEEAGIGVRGVADGLKGLGVSGTGYRGVTGFSGSASGNGVYGESIGDFGIGVAGVGATGIRGDSGDQEDGVGVLGVGKTGVFGSTGFENGVGVFANALASGGIAIEGMASQPDGIGIHVSNTSFSGLAYAAYAHTASPSGVAILGDAPGNASGTAIGVRGQTAGPFSLGMFATNTATSAPATALRATNTAVGGITTTFASLGAGASRAIEASSAGVAPGANAVRASLTDLGSNGDAVYAFSQSSSGTAGRFANNSGTAIALAGGATAFEATGNGVISGDLGVFGTLSAAAKFFRIDHPLEPEQRYLQHAAIESDRLLTLYSGNVVTDASGVAEVVMPEWFEALNRDFRYQLTVIGSFARAIVAEEISDGRFVIRTDAAEVKVSWQVTAERQDAWALANPLDIEPLRAEIGPAEAVTGSVTGAQQ